MRILFYTRKHSHRAQLRPLRPKKPRLAPTTGLLPKEKPRLAPTTGLLPKEKSRRAPTTGLLPKEKPRLTGEVRA